MPRSGTLLICVQNMDCSGANQVVLNLAAGYIRVCNIVVLSPKTGPFVERLATKGVTVRIGTLDDALHDIRDVFSIICNTIMTANIVVAMAKRPYPVMWILHEWWDDDMIVENLKIRNYKDLTLETVKTAMECANAVVCVCESQRSLYNPSARSEVVFVGVPDPVGSCLCTPPLLDLTPSRAFTFLCLGIICPRKNQRWTVQVFQEFCKKHPNVNARLEIVGARYIRDYEVAYLNQLKAAIQPGDNIQIYDVTDEVDNFYRRADCLVLTSLNEVTPMVISEALSWSLPVISTNIAGIKEMFRNGVEGFHFDPNDTTSALAAMEAICLDDELRITMGRAARRRYEECFRTDVMVQGYHDLLWQIAPPVVLVDMDGVLVDWDAGFRKQWDNRSPLDRSLSYYMEDCIPASYREEAVQTYMAKGFFRNLPAMKGGISALEEMAAEGIQVFLCTTPVADSLHCAQEKIEWVREHLGNAWVKKMILCHDKTMVQGDILIDDKVIDTHCVRSPWRQIIFDAPYNRDCSYPRLSKWRDWKKVLFPLLDKIWVASHDAKKSHSPTSGLEALSLMPSPRSRSHSRVHSG